MSRDRVLVSLAPDAVAWVRLSGFVKARAVAHGAVDADPAHGKDAWGGAVAALAVLAQGWQRERISVTVVLSNHFVRYALVDAPPRGVSAEEALGLARFHFAKLHGDRAAAWDVRIALAGRGKPRVASAIDRALLAALQALFDRPSRARLASVQPYLMCAFNRWRERLSRGGWLVLAEPGRICLAMLAGDRWAALQTARSADDASDEWLALLEREAQRVPTQPVPSNVYARVPAGSVEDASSHAAWQVAVLHAPSLQGIPDTERERYALALHAA